MRKLLITLAVLSTFAFAAAGCGSEDEAASGASELVPAGALMYGEATLDPEGDQKEAIDSILAKFPGGGQAGEKLKELIEKGLRESDAPISFKDDIEPWLGDEAGFFASTVGQSGEPSAAVALIATDDEDQAAEALEKSAEGKITRHNYKDVEYLTDGGGEAGAVFDGFLVLGTESGVKAVIDTSKGGKKLSDDEDYKNALEGASEDRLGLFYLNSPQFLKSMPQGTALPQSFEKYFKEPFVATVDADKDGVLFEGKVPEETAQTFGFVGKGSDLLTDMPAESWVAMAQTDFGKLLNFYVDAFAGVAGGRDAIEQQFKAATGLDLQRDVIDWMGDFGIFVRGSSLSELDGALVIETKDEQASGRALAALARIARQQGGGSGVSVGPLTAPGGGEGYTLRSPDIPKPIHFFQQGGRVVLSYGDAAAEDAVDPGEKLGDDPDFTSARDSLGDYEVSMYVQMQPIFDLVDSTEAANDADWQKAKPYLEPLSALVAGTSGEGDDLKSAVKLIVR
jgi:Protein of unknown function (DUF3352)